MNEDQNAEEAAKSGQDHLKSAANDLQEAAGAKIENIRQTAEQKADGFRETAEGKVQEFRGAAQQATLQAKSWQADSPATGFRTRLQKARLTFGTIRSRRSWSLWEPGFFWAFFFEDESSGSSLGSGSQASFCRQPLTEFNKGP
jgi:uncharacterized protein YjbJ (UPF0337 family)